MIAKIAKDHGKAMALTETGYEGIKTEKVFSYEDDSLGNTRTAGKFFLLLCEGNSGSFIKLCFMSYKQKWLQKFLKI